ALAFFATFALERLGRHIGRLALFQRKGRHLAYGGDRRRLGGQRPQRRQPRRDRPDRRLAALSRRRPQLKQGHADEQLAVEAEVRGPVDLVAVDEGAVPRFEILDLRAVVLGSDAHVAARDELVLHQRPARRWVAAQLDRTGERK